MNKRIYKVLFLLLTLIYCSITAFASDTSGREVIKVGYYANYGIVNLPMIRGSEGYGYEYLNEVIRYTDNKYTLEFVECATWEEGFELVKNGEIDLYGPVNYTEEREQEYRYSADDYGNESIYLATLPSDMTHYNDVEGISKGSVGVQSNSYFTEMLERYYSNNQIEPITIIADMNHYLVDLEQGNYDYCVASSLQNIKGLKVIESLGVEPFYFITSYENEELMNELDVAKEKLQKSNYIFEEQIYIEYFAKGLSSKIDITKEEYDLLNEQEEYVVAFIDDYQPISYRDESGEPQGIFIDVINKIAEETGINVTFVSTTVADWGFADYDMSMTVSVEGDKVYSDPYMEFPFVLVEKRHSRENLDVVGVLDYYDLDRTGLTNYLGDRACITYETFEEIGEALDKDKISSMIISNIGFNTLYNTLQIDEFTMAPLDMGLSLDMVFAEDFSPAKIDAINKLLSHISADDRNYLMVKHMGTETSEKSQSFHEYIKANPMVVVYFCIGVVIFITLYEKRKKHILEHIIDFDDVTGLLTEHKFRENTRLILDNHGDKKFSIVAIDIDNFKYINEIYGYNKGTEVLKALGGYIKKRTKIKYPVARIYSDNFLLLVEGENCKQKIESFIETDQVVEQIFSKFLGESYKVYFSIGVYEVKNHSMALSYMVDCANLARVVGKTRTETTLNYFTEDMKREREANNEIVARMEQAMVNEEFVLYYQPKMNLKTNQIVGVEALSRWMSDGIIMPPNEFIPIFEKNGFIEKLDYYVLKKTCEFINVHQDLPIPKIAINMSAVTLMQEAMVSTVVDIMRKSGVDPSRIEIEVTESAFVDSFNKCTSKLDELRKAGFTISMDDFGTGISSLDRLHALNIDVLKIDRSFVTNSIDNVKGSIILESMIKMAQELGLEIVAEGIETESQLEKLQKLQCEFGQGHYFSRALPEEEFIEYLSRCIQDLDEW